MRMPAIIKTLILLLFAWLAFFAVDAHAAIDNAGVFDSVLDRYQAAASGWVGVITAAASRLFWTLVVISMIWTFGMMALRKADIGEFFAEFVRFIIFTGFFWWALINGPNFASSIFASLRQLAGEATGLGNVLSPSSIVDVGFALFDKVMDESSAWTPVDSMAGILMALAILVILALVGVNMLLLLASGWMLAYGGVFFLGFGGSRWTSDMAISYYKTVLGVAAQLFSMVLLVGIGKTFLADYYSRMNAGISLKEMGVLLIVVIILLALTNKIPSLIAGIITGGSVGNTGIGQFGAGAVVGAAGLAAAAASTGQAMIAAGSANMAGGAQAVMAAFSKASDQVASGSDVLSNMWSSGGGGTAGTHGVAGDNSTGQTPFAQAAGFSGNSAGSGFGPASDSPGSVSASGGLMGSAAKAGKIAVDAGANLARGTSAVAKAKLAALGSSALDRIGDTVGGQIASAIRAQDVDSPDPSGSPQRPFPSFADNSLSGERQLDPEAEVAAFANRDRSPT